MVAIVTGVVMGEDGRLVTTCCDSNGGLGDSLLLIELEVFTRIVNINNIVIDIRLRDSRSSGLGSEPWPTVLCS